MNLVATPLYLTTLDAGFEADFQARLHWSAQADADIEQRVAEILTDVQQRGDAAVLDYTRRFDALDAAGSLVPIHLSAALIVDETATIAHADALGLFVVGFDAQSLDLESPAAGMSGSGQ
jgi:hypothetical protein